MFLTGTLAVQVYKDTAQTAFPTQKLVDISETFSDTAVAEMQDTYFNLAASTGQTINLNSVATVRKVYIYSDTTDLSVNFNGLGNLTYKATVPGIMPIEVTSLVITNASSTTATNVAVVLITG